MAIKLSANYSKKLGLPHFSSHSFSASVEIELTDITQVEAELQKLYEMLQHSVDQEIQNPGFVPEGNGSPKPQPTRTYQPNGRQQNGTPKPIGDRWNCTDGQKGFILRILNENHLNKLQSIHSLHYRQNTGETEKGIELHHLVKLKSPNVGFR